MKESRILKRKGYFIQAAIDIIKRDGIENLTARNLGIESGYTTSTLYNYFESLDYLENIACIHFIKEYTDELTFETEEMENTLEIYIKMWEIFLKHAFRYPDFYYNVFYSGISKDESINLFKEYYEIFPEEIPTTGGYILGMMDITNTHKRGLYVLEKCGEEGSLREDRIIYINDIHIGYTNHLMSEFVKTKTRIPTKELYFETLRYIIYSMEHYVCDKYKDMIANYLEKYSQEDFI